MEIAAVVLLLVLIIAGVNIVYSLAICGSLLIFSVDGSLGFTTIGENLFHVAGSTEFAAIPLYVLIGEVLVYSRVAEQSLAAINRLVARGRRGLVYSSLVGSGLFAAVSGSSVATAATLSRVTWPPMRDAGHPPSSALGSIAGGATLGLLIPPSLSFIIYGSITGVSIGTLFIAGIVPGLILLMFFLIVARLTPAGAQEDAHRGPERSLIGSLLDVAPLFLLMGWILGSIYLGIATVLESAAVGGVVAVALTAVMGRLNWATLGKALHSTIAVSAPLLLILVTASLFSTGITRSGLVSELNSFVTQDLALESGWLIFAICVLYLVLGMVMDGMSLLVITLPVFFPLVIASGLDGVWFGVLITILIEVALITPPVGLNLFVLAGATGIPIGSIFRGAIPYCGAMLVLLILIIAFPGITQILI